MDVDQGAQIPDQLILYRLAQKKNVISGFRREEDENGAGLCYYAA